MKKLILPVLLLIAVSTQAQFHVQAGIGASSHKSVAGDFHMGYDFKLAFLQVGMLSQMSQSVEAGTMFNVKLGHTIWLNDELCVQPALGYAYILKSNDNKSLNVNTAIYSLTVGRCITDQIQLYASGNYADKTFIGTVGLRLSLPSNN